MKITRAVAGIAAVAAALAFAPFASAGTNEGFVLDKAEYQPGETIRLAYDATSHCEGKASSNGFVDRYSSEFVLDPPHILRATASAVQVAGKYTAEMICGGQPVSRTFEVVHAQGSDLFFLDSGEVEAGGDVSVMKTKQSVCGNVATSPGFTAPIELKYESQNLRIGNGKAVDVPGVYQVQMICKGQPVLQQLVVKAKALKPVPSPITAKPKAKAPIVKPKGAPQTGGGGTA